MSALAKVTIGLLLAVCYNVSSNVISVEGEGSNNDNRRHPKIAMGTKNIWSITESPAKVWTRNRIAKANLLLSGTHANHPYQSSHRGSISQTGLYHPGDQASPFTLLTLEGILKYPSDRLPSTAPIILHAYSSRSAFLRCLWNCTGSIESLIKNKPKETHLIFISQEDDAYNDAKWMRNRFMTVLKQSDFKNRVTSFSVVEKLHFVTTPLYQLGNWLPAVFKQWMCSGHNCGLAQAVFNIPSGSPIILPRLDARYDWLPPFKLDTSYNLSRLITGCNVTSGIQGLVALVTDAGCSYFDKIKMAEKSGAVGVVVVPMNSSTPLDMNCNGAECNVPISIPATMIDLVTKNKSLQLVDARTMTLQNTPYENFFFSIDHQGSLQEVGWLLYPSFQFLVWHAQWVEYASRLKADLRKDAFIIPVLNKTRMQGSHGAVATIDLPPMSHMASFSKLELDMALSCPGSFDTTCPHWDHTVQLFVCCNKSSPLCGAELGRWISPFRRQIGRWLTDVTSLLPLMDGPRCTFTMKTVPWAMPWSPSLNLRFSGTRPAVSPIPYRAIPLYSPGATFDKHYNSHFTPYSFKVPLGISKLEIVSVITGHGSDENGCGEFCVTSHHFVINNSPPHVITYDTAGSPLGCADRVPYGVEPNEHGTWLYGRDGWCDGQEVDPWIIDITSQIDRENVNDIRYFGWFNGTDPNPKSNPGLMTLYSYLIFYNG